MDNDIVRRSYFDECRFLPLNEEKGEIQGHAAVYDKRTNLGCFEEIIERGAFDGADMSDVPLFVNHDLRKIPLARSRRNNGSSTMTLSIDAKGLLIDARLDIEKNTEAKSLYSSVARGDLDGMSFMFRIKDEEWENLDSDLPLRRIKKISKVFEVSAVNFPAYTDTDISARNAEALDSAKATLDSVRSQTAEQLEVLKLKTKFKLRGDLK